MQKMYQTYSMAKFRRLCPYIKPKITHNKQQILLNTLITLIINQKYSNIIQRFKKHKNISIISMKVSQQDQKKMFEQHLQMQQKTREQKIEQKKLAQLQKKNPEQHMLYIQKQFKNKAEDIDAAVKKYKQKNIDFNQLMKHYSQAKEYYVNMSYALKTYDRQTYKQQLDKMYNSIVDLKKKNEPRKKFKFSRRQQDFGVKYQAKDQVEIHKQSHIVNIAGIQSKTNQSIVFQRDPSHTVPQSYKILQCTDCTIQLKHTTQILFLKNLKNCTIKTALTKSTVFVDHCQNCTFQLNCHQLRIHNTYDSVFRIFVTSKAIIQDCNRVKFGVYTYQYEGRSQDQEKFQRKGKDNLWREIQDFNWLKENQKSPHYQLIQQQQSV